MARKFNQGPTVRGTRVELNISMFPGFYYSSLSGMLDSAFEQDVDNLHERQGEDGIATELRLTEAEISELMFDAQKDMATVEEDMAKDYVTALEWELKGQLPFKTNLRFATMVSPREYNFSTDRLFATVSKTTVKRMFAMSRRNNHAELSRIIAERFTSRDGFASHYKNDLASWVAVKVVDWDENEVGALFDACLAIAGLDQDELRNGIECSMAEHDYEYHQAAHDWTKFEAAVADAREAKAEALRALDPDYVAPPPRCELTADLFAR